MSIMNDYKQLRMIENIKNFKEIEKILKENDIKISEVENEKVRHKLS